MFEVKRIAADLLFHLKSQILHTFEKKLGEIQESGHQEDLDSANGIIDIMKDKLKALFRELNDNELETGINGENKSFLAEFLK